MKYQVKNESLFKSALNMVAYFEGLRLTAYRCPAGCFTIGYGHRLALGESHASITKDRAIDLLTADFGRCVDMVFEVFPHLWECELFALASLTYNLGMSWADVHRNLYREVNELNKLHRLGLTSSRLLFNVKYYMRKYVNAKVNGKPVKFEGLVKRRCVECDFLDGIIPDFKEYCLTNKL